MQSVIHGFLQQVSVNTLSSSSMSRSGTVPPSAVSRKSVNDPNELQQVRTVNMLLYDFWQGSSNEQFSINELNSKYKLSQLSKVNSHYIDMNFAVGISAGS